METTGCDYSLIINGSLNKDDVWIELKYNCAIENYKYNYFSLFIFQINYVSKRGPQRLITRCYATARFQIQVRRDLTIPYRDIHAMCEIFKIISYIVGRSQPKSAVTHVFFHKYSFSG